MSADMHATKQELRRRIRAEWSAVTPGERIAASGKAVALLRVRPEWQRAHSVMMYAPLADELDLWSLALETVAAGRLVAFPRFVVATGLYEAARVKDLEKELAPGFRGVREPEPDCPAVPLRRFDFVLVPGRGFDRSGGRLGRGKGIYDRLLADMDGLLCGVAMDWQVMSRIPTETHDRGVDHILTPTRWIECRRPIE